MATLIVFPDAGTGLTTVDGSVLRSAVDETLSVIRSGAGTSVFASSTTSGIDLRASTTINQFQDLRRLILTFDTSVVGFASSATLSLFGSSRTFQIGAPNLHITQVFPQSNNNIVTNDFNAFSSISLANISDASWSDTAYNDFILSNTDAIAPGGITALGVRTDWDINNNFTGVWTSGGISVNFSVAADTAGTTQDPKLVVVYTTDAYALNRINLFPFPRRRNFY